MTVPSVADVLSLLGRAAPSSKAAAWDPVGLQIGDPAAPVGSAAVCHEVSPWVVDATTADPPDLLVTYHPLLFQPTSRLVAGNSAGGRALRLARAGIALAVIHTDFDVAPGGTAAALADALGLAGARGFGPVWAADSFKVVTFVPADRAAVVTEAMSDAGGGVIGNYSACSFRSEGTGTFFAGAGADPAAGSPGALNLEPELRIEMVASAGRLDAVVAALVAAHPYEEPAYDVYDRRGDAGFAGRIGRLLHPIRLGAFAIGIEERLGGIVRVAGPRDREVRSVAVVPGSGSDFAPAAAAAGADVLVTGDVSHHRARAAVDRGVAVVDPGHLASERPGVKNLYAAMEQIIPGCVDLTADEEIAWWRGDGHDL
jgi:dinuclear metal center YbgI/SA1388 family protein